MNFTEIHKLTKKWKSFILVPIVDFSFPIPLFNASFRRPISLFHQVVTNFIQYYVIRWDRILRMYCCKFYALFWLQTFFLFAEKSILGKVFPLAEHTIFLPKFVCLLCFYCLKQWCISVGSRELEKHFFFLKWKVFKYFFLFPSCTRIDKSNNW
jgi:hypothetical protein